MKSTTIFDFGFHQWLKSQNKYPIYKTKTHLDTNKVITHLKILKPNWKIFGWKGFLHMLFSDCNLFNVPDWTFQNIAGLFEGCSVWSKDGERERDSDGDE